VTMPQVRALAQALGTNHPLAQELWASGIHEARIMATIVADPAQVTFEDAKKWALDFETWDLCDQCCLNLFCHTSLKWDLVEAWANAPEEWLKRAAFALMAVLAVHEKNEPDARFVGYLSLVETAAEDPRNFVKKAVNWALRQLGKRSWALRQAALDLALTLSQRAEPAPRWIGKDAYKELSDPKTQARIQR